MKVDVQDQGGGRTLDVDGQGGGGLENWIIFMNVICVSSLNCENISSFVLIIDFEQANICCVNIENTNTFEGKIRYIMRSVVVF